MSRRAILTLMVCIFITACRGHATSTPDLPSESMPTQTFPALAYASLPTATAKPKRFSPITPVATSTPTELSTKVPRLPERDPATWKTWPVIPETVDASLKMVYQRGLELGNDP